MHKNEQEVEDKAYKNVRFPLGKHRFSIKEFTRDIDIIYDSMCVCFSNILFPEKQMEDIADIIC